MLSMFHDPMRWCAHWIRLALTPWLSPPPTTYICYDMHVLPATYSFNRSSVKFYIVHNMYTSIACDSKMFLFESTEANACRPSRNGRLPNVFVLFTQTHMMWMNHVILTSGFFRTHSFSPIYFHLLHSHKYAHMHDLSISHSLRLGCVHNAL